MSKIGNAALEIQEMELEAGKDCWLTRIHPVAKLLITILYILIVVSVDKYDLTSLILFAIYPVVLMITGEYSFRLLWKRMKIFFLMAFLLGIANPFFDRSIIGQIGQIKLTGGTLSMLTLFIKGGLAISGSYLLICSTSMNGIGYALRCLHIPKILVMVLMLIYRYIFIFLSEADKMVQAYSLRAPGQKGIHYKVWGSMIGQMLLRSMDRAEMVYYSMKVRGYQGELLFYPRKRWKGKDLLYLFAWTLIFLLLIFVGKHLL